LIANSFGALEFGRGCALLACLGGSWLVREFALQEEEWAQKWGKRWIAYRQPLEQNLIFLRSKWTGQQVMLVQLVCIVGALLVVKEAPELGLALFLGVPLIHFVISWQRRRRLLALEAQVEGWIGALGRALEASPSLGDALESTLMASVSPLREELELVVREISLGLSLERALVAWDQRAQSRVLSMALATLQIGRQTGGSLPRVLKDAAAVLREMERLEGVVRTKTAEGRAQSIVIGGLPLLIYVVMNEVSPKHFDPLKYTAVGQVLVGLAALLWLGALFFMKKILAVRI
jgi:tight adherence protein B